MKLNNPKTREERRAHWLARAIVQRTILGVAVAVLLIVIALILTLSPSGAESIEPTEAPQKGVSPVILQLASDDPDAPNESTAECLAKLIWGEARGCITMEQAAVVWCALNRVDNEDSYYPDSIIEVVHQENQFTGYQADNPVLPEFVALAEDVLARWLIEDKCVGDVGRVLPKEYLFFDGDGKHNYFRTEYIGGDIWDWSLDDPYGGERA